MITVISRYFLAKVDINYIYAYAVHIVIKNWLLHITNAVFKIPYFGHSAENSII